MRAPLIPRLAAGGSAFLCVTISADAAAPRRPALPRYDTQQLCETGIEGTPGQVLRELCIRPEREALADLRRRWSALPAQTLTRCIEQQTSLQQTYGSGGSYRGLKTCVDEPIQSVGEIPPTELRTATGARARRGGTTTGSTAATTNNPPTPGTGIGTGTGLGTPGLGTPGFGTTGTGLGTTGTGSLGLGNTGLGGTTGTGLGTPGLGTGAAGTGTGGTGLGASGLGTSGGTGSSLGGSPSGATAGAAGGSGGGAGGGGGR